MLGLFSPGIKEGWLLRGGADRLAKATPVLGEANPMASIDMKAVMNGTFDTATLPAAARSIIELPGYNFLKLCSVFGLMQNPNPAKAPWRLYPSFDWTVEVQGDLADREIFSGPLLPLPQATAGKLRLDEAALKPVIDSELHSWLFGSAVKDPVIYIAFGTIVKANTDLVGKMASALQGGRWRVIWSLPAELHATLPSGLAKDRWLVRDRVPQMEVLRCEAVKCFISHCGANSTTEAMACGVPMVCHPFYMDQYDWARTVRKHLRAGVQVDKFDSGPEAIRRAVSEVLRTPAYAEAAQAVAQRMQDHAAHLAGSFGPAMRPNAHLGPGCHQPGCTVIAGIIIALMKGKDVSDVASLM